MTGAAEILRVERLSKRFGGLHALEDVSFGVRQASVHGIIGPNGAGKSTLFNVITGHTPADRGAVLLQGRTLGRMTPHRLVPLGVARTFQNLRLFRDMTVLDNVLIGQHVHTPTPVLSILMHGAKARRGEAAGREAAARALHVVGLEAQATHAVRNLPYGQQKLVEFARALAAQPTLLLLDEPAAGMTPTEKANLLRLVQALPGRGVTVVLIEHDMKVVMNVCDMITVLDHGRRIAEGRPEEIRRHPDVIAAYLGRGPQ